MNIRSLCLIAEGLLFAFASQMPAAAHGSGVLSAAVNYPVGASPQTIVAGDFNGDGHLDLATLNPVHAIQYTRVNVSVLLGDGSGGLGDAINSDVGANLYTNDPYWAAFSLTVADFNNDSHLDLAMAIPFQSLVTGEFGGASGVSLGNGDGTFQASTGLPALGSIDAVASGDFNNDGNSDLAVTGVASGFSNYGYAQVLQGNGQGAFASSTYASSFESNYYEQAVGDLNGDGKLDAVAMAGQYGEWGVALLGNGGANGDFSGSYELSTAGVRSAAVAVGNFTGDGIPDLAVAGDAYFQSDAGVEIGTGLGDGTFNFSIPYSANGYDHTGVAVADFNGDGLLDAVTSDPDTGTVSLLLGNGNGALTYAAAYAVGSLPTGIAVGDFNGDGRTDVATANSGSYDVSVLLNQMAPAPPGDFTHDGAVDGADFLVWQRDDRTLDGLTAWKNNVGGSSAVPTAAVPEPAAGALALLGVSSILLVRGRSVWRPNRLSL